jgi:hypothetical protein
MKKISLFISFVICSMLLLNFVSALEICQSFSVPSEPTNIIISYDAINDEVIINWDDSVSPCGVSSYEIYNNGILIGTVSGTITEFKDSNYQLNNQYVIIVYDQKTPPFVSSTLASASSSSFVVDTTAPVITLSGADPQIIEFGNRYVELGATANDNYDGDITSSIVIDKSNLNIRNVGDYQIKYDVVDTNGNNAVQVIRTVSVVDTTSPTIDAVANQVVEATSSSGAIATYIIPTSHDLVDGDLISSCDIASGSTFSLGTTTVTCTKTDVAGNMAIPSTFTITVQDTTAPELNVNSPANNSVFLTTDKIIFNISVNEPINLKILNNSSPINSSPIIADASGLNWLTESYLPAGIYLIKIIAEDASLNSNTSLISITVNNPPAPSSGGGSGGSSGRACTTATTWECSEWSACESNTQTRTCFWAEKDCKAPLEVKPEEIQTCELVEEEVEEVQETPSAEEETVQTSGITGAVIGTLTSPSGLVVIFLVIIGATYLVLRYRKAK